MRRRLLSTMVGLVVLALVLVGAGTAVVASTRAASTTERHVADQTRAMAAAFEDAMPYLTRRTFSQARLERLRRSLDLEEIGLVLVPRDGGSLQFLSELPDVLTEADLRPLAEDPVGPDEAIHTSGVRGETAWAAAVIPLRPDATGPAIVVVATRRLVDPLAGTYGWMLFGALASIIVSVLVALRLSRSVARPVAEVAVAAHQIADGRLDTRLTRPANRRPDEVTELVTAVNAMAEGLERSRGLERQFLLSVSHDLRTPMTSIRGYAEGLADGTIRNPVRAGEVILAEASRLERLVRDLLELARIDARQFTLDLHVIDLGTATSKVVDGFGPAAAEAGIELTAPDPLTTTDAGLVGGAMVDHDRWAQVVGNLLENGLRYAATTLDVTVEQVDRWIEARVADDGPGIAPADLPHVFERPYVAQHSPADRESGSGLGLAIVRELVEAMDGEVEAVAPPDGGTEMVVRLPSVDRPPDQRPSVSDE